MKAWGLGLEAWGTRLGAWLAAFGLIAAQISLHADTPVSTRVFRYLMGTSITIEATGGTPAARQEAIDEAFASMMEIDRLMSNYRSDSELAAINRGAADYPVKVSDPMWSVLSAAQMVSRRSEGAFDVTVGPLVKLWGFHDKQPHIPEASELARIRPIIGFNHMVLNDSTHTVAFTRPGVEIDLGGIAKGFAVELAGGVLRRRGFTGFIDAGGNQYFVGHPVDKSRWRVGIENPDHPNTLLGTLDIDEGATSTSGGYHNFFVANGKTYGHLLDPRTLAPSEGSLSVTIVSPDATLADALSKPAFILGPTAGLRFVESFPGTMAIIASRGPGGRIDVTMSAGLESRFKRSDASDRTRD